MIRKSTTLKLAATIALAGLSYGADKISEATGSESKSESVSISLLAVGDLPPILYKDTAKGPVFIPLPKKDTPPPLLFVKAEESEKGFSQLGLSLNTPMPPIQQKQRSELNIFADQASARGEEDASKTPYLSVSLPDEGNNFTVILARNPKTRNWRTKPKSFVLKNDAVTFPANSVRMINLSSYPVKGKLAGGETISLSPAAANLSGKIVPIKENQQVLTYQLVGKVKEKTVPLADTATSFYPGTRLNIVFYDGDGADSKDKLRFCLFPEIPLKPSPPQTPLEN